MATVKRANVPATHPTVYVGLALAVVGLLLAMYAYTGARVYDIAFAFIAMAGGVLSLLGIMVAAWGRSIMASRASRARRGTFSRDAFSIARAEETPPTIAAPSGKAQPAGALFAFRRKPPATREPAADDPRNPDVAARLDPPQESVSVVVAEPVRATLRCPQCANEFTAEGVRPFQATCGRCGFAATV